MFITMVVLTVAGVALLVSAPFIGRVARGRGKDAVALTRILQLVAIALLVVALLARPSNPETTAVPPPPDAVGGGR